MTKLSNKEYKAARIDAESAPEVFTFEHYAGGLYCTRYMSGEDIKEMRKDYKAIKSGGAYALDGFGGRALIIPAGDELILKSYYTDVCKYNLKTDEFTKLWDGFSVTTLKHINLFRSFLALETLSKREWIEL